MASYGWAIAGFDFHFKKSPAGEQLQGALLRWIQGQARDLDLRFRFYSEDGEFWGVLDGPLIDMHLLRAYLSEDFYGYAAALPIAAGSSSACSHSGLIARLIRWRAHADHGEHPRNRRHARSVQIRVGAKLDRL